MRSEDADFARRFRELNRECSVGSAYVGSMPRVGCVVGAEDGSPVVGVRFDESESLDPVAFLLDLFGDRGYEEISSPVKSWRLVAGPGAPYGALAFYGDVVLFDRCHSWQRLVGNIAVSRLLRLQQDVLFFHAASVGAAAGGMMLTGHKGTGKTTLALALAARGCAFFGDEIAAVDGDTLRLLPFRRSVSVRPGPTTVLVRRALDRAHLSTEVFPDGTMRRRAHVQDVFPNAVAESASLKYVVFLKGVTGRSRLVPVAATPPLAGLLAPLASSMWGRRPGVRAMQLFSLVSRVNCYALEAGDPEETVELLAALGEQR